MPTGETEEDLIDAHPTKEFFVDMITIDIPLEQAILDLVDNSIDAANRKRREAGFSLGDYSIHIEVSGTRFEMRDNCGGFDKTVARSYAFRFGRPSDRKKSPHSIGQFGIGMKRALFKFGKHFSVRSATSDEEWAIDVDVDLWKEQKAWTFPWEEDFPEDMCVSEGEPGTQIIVDQLYEEVASSFGTKQFITLIEDSIRSKHRQFIASGLRIFVNERPLVATDLNFLSEEELRPAFTRFQIDKKDSEPVLVRIVTGVSDSSPSAAGWYVVCNGRVVLEADRSKNTGWGTLEESRGELMIPRFHNQFARFRGIVWFDCEDSARVPWNTMKTDVDRESRVWQQSFPRMMELMRPVIDFLNELDEDIAENTRDGSALYRYVSRAERVAGDALTEKSVFSAPKAKTLGSPKDRPIKIQYSRPLRDIDFLKEAYDVSSAVAVGERTFDLALRKQKGK